MPTSKSPLRFLLTGAGIQLLTLIVSAAIGFVLTPLMIHTLGDRDYGIFELVGSFVGWMTLVDFGLSGAVTRFVAVSFSKGHQKECAAYAATGFYVYLILGMVAFALASLATLPLPRLLSHQTDVPMVRILLLLAAASFAVEMPLRALSGLVNGYMRRDISSTLWLVGRIIRALATVGALFLGGRLIAISATLLIVGLTMFLVWMIVVKLAIPAVALKPRYVTRDKVTGLISFGGISFIGQLAEAVIFRVDGFVIAWFIAVAAVPHYMIAVALVGYFQSAMVALTSWLMNWFAHKDAKGKDAVMESLYLSTRYSVIVGGFCLFGLIAFGKPFIHRWMGPDYLDAYPCLVALGIGEFFRALQRPNMNLLLTRAKHYIYTLTRVFEAILNLILSVVLVQSYGILGVALGTMFASIVTNGLLLSIASVVVTQASGTRYAIAILHGLAIVALLITIPGLIVSSTATPDYSSLFLLGIVSAFLYFPLALVLGTSRMERRRLLSSFLG